MSNSRAVVVGGSVAGLLAARVLADHFDRVTLVERDALPETAPGVRRHLPQAGHQHILRVCGQTLYRWGSPLYNFKDLAFHKMRFRGEPRKLYFCKRGLGILSTLGLSLKATRIL